MKVSIITATLNASACIETLLKSVQGQTYPEIEHVIVDGASTDKTLEIIERYRTEKMKVVSELDAGIYPALNKGISLATGEVLIVMGADDRFYDLGVISEAVDLFLRKNARFCKLHPQLANWHKYSFPGRAGSIYSSAYANGIDKSGSPQM